MAYLIDGNNLIGRISPYELRDKSGRHSLVAKLLAFQRVTRRRLHVVFDGGPDDELTSIVINPKLTVWFPPRGQSADEIIIGMLQAQSDRRQLTLVSSDRRLIEAARQGGFAFMKSEEFASLIKPALKERGRQKAMEKKVEEPSPLELSLWEDVLGKRK